MKKVKQWMIGIIFILSICSVGAQELIVDYLSHVRDDIVFPQMSNSEKRLVAEQAQILLRDLYVHRFQKNNYYGNGFDYDSNGHFDPVPAIEEIVEDIDDMSVEEMEHSIYNIFVNQRDLHLNYILPAPYSRYRSFLPLTLTRVADGWKYLQVRVNAVNADQFSQFMPGQRIPDIGDILVSYDELPTYAAIERQKQTAQGANFFGGFSRSLGQMTMINHRLHLLPEEDSVEMTFRSASSGELYTVELPWLTQWIQRPSTLMRMDLKPEKRVKPEDLIQGIDLWQKDYNEFIKANNLEQKSVYPNNPSNEPVLTWGIIEKDSVKYGYLRLASFAPQKGGDFALGEITRIINEEFYETEGLIIDVRNNGGGSISFADKMSQLFMPGNAQVIKARLLNKDLNRDIFNYSEFGNFSKPEWTRVINDAKGTGNIYSELAPFTYDDEANELGQAYYKNIVVLTNARCYSSTDIFSSAMQDNGAAIILGEDPKTGAGGANVIRHNFFESLVGAPFKPLPYGHAMRVSWRQSIRFGFNEGALIEDYGCSADMDISLSPSDVIDGGTEQLNKIITYLSMTSNPFESDIRMEFNNRNLFLEQSASINLTVSNTQYVKVYINDLLYKEFAVNALANKKNVAIQLPVDLKTGVLNKMIIIGEDWTENPKWNVKRNVIILEEKIVLNNDGFTMDFNKLNNLGPMKILNKQNEASEGWNLAKPYLQVGYNGEYVNNVDTDAVLLFDFSNREMIELSFTMEVDTEVDYDFIEVSLSDNSTKEVLLFESGQIPENIYKMDISRFANRDNIVLHYRFTSDGGVVAPGVRIKQISVK